MSFLPTADWPTLRQRADLLRRTRAFFDERGFVEVETPILSADTVVDRHLDPLVTSLEGLGPARTLYLQTSPEFAMKRLMAAGGEAIYQITHAFRQGERGPRHNPEFTIVEWYRRGDDYAAGMQLLSHLCAALLAHGPAEHVTYREAFLRYVGIDPLTATDDTIANAARVKLPDAAAAFGRSQSPPDRDAWLDLLLTSLVEPHLGLSESGTPRPTILCDYPPSQAALAQVRDDEPPVAERFELYVAGLELANGYHELLDAEALRLRNQENNHLRTADGKPTLPGESRLLEAMRQGLPACTGCALGFDRVVMLAAGKQDIAQVIPFPVERA
ncbi:MAG: EF-P lysine aminoacylase GenX [Planctomycetaceae bacterium]|nr:EF-P lysine aminoacylase GenX [Planctomycetaceae bacterium]